MVKKVEPFANFILEENSFSDHSHLYRQSYIINSG